MNPSPESPDDPQLRGLLREARPSPALPPSFRNEVWRRIERAGSTVPANWLEYLVAWLLRPRWATVGLALVMLTGVLLGARQAQPNDISSAQARYVASVNPVQPRP